VQLPPGVDGQRLYRQAIAQNILIGSGSLFFPDEQGYPALRLSFAQPLEDIEQGIATLGKLLRQMI
jgi:DNA-binding transcriptional MocR family regulator